MRIGIVSFFVWKMIFLSTWQLQNVTEKLNCIRFVFQVAKIWFKSKTAVCVCKCVAHLLRKCNAMLLHLHVFSCSHQRKEKPGRLLQKKKAMLRLLINFILSLACFIRWVCAMFFFLPSLLYYSIIFHFRFARTHSLVSASVCALFRWFSSMFVFFHYFLLFF